MKIPSAAGRLHVFSFPSVFGQWTHGAPALGPVLTLRGIFVDQLLPPHLCVRNPCLWVKNEMTLSCSGELLFLPHISFEAWLLGKPGLVDLFGHIIDHRVSRGVLGSGMHQ